MCFEIILSHFMSSDIESTHSVLEKYIIYFENKAVSVFMLLAFTFLSTYKMVLNKKGGKRLERLIIPK